MSDVLSEIQNRIYSITLNRIHVHNAFDDQLIATLIDHLEVANEHPDVRVIVLKANGRHFSAGADLNWMKKMAHFTEAQNKADARNLAQLMEHLYLSPKPVIAAVQGSAFGGGAGLVAACDIAICSRHARFCFSEVKLGLIPAVISPYVIKAIGARAANWLFMSAESFDAQRAYELQLVHHCVDDEALLKTTYDLAYNMTQFAPGALKDCKRLVQTVAELEINAETRELTSDWIAKQRVSKEGQTGLNAFLNKEKPNWD